MTNINIDKFKELMKEDGVCVLDVRTLDEFENGFIADAVNYDFFDINFRDDILKLDREKKYLIYCRSGQRSSQAMSFMKSNGFTCFNLINGVLGWLQAGQELVEEKE